MTAPSNTPDKPMTREETFQLALHDSRYITISLSDVLDYSPISTSQFRHVFSAGESFNRQSILKEAGEIMEILLASHGCWTDGGPEIPEEISAHFDIGMANARKIVAFCAKLKGEGV